MTSIDIFIAVMLFFIGAGFISLGMSLKLLDARIIYLTALMQAKKHLVTDNIISVKVEIDAAPAIEDLGKIREHAALTMKALEKIRRAFSNIKKGSSHGA